MKRGKELEKLNLMI